MDTATHKDQVVVLDDNLAVRESLEQLLMSHGYSVRLHADPEDFFQVGLPPVNACLLLDNHLGEYMSGMLVHAEIVRRGWFIPTIFLTAHWNVQMVVNAMRTGADGYLTKPFDPAELLAAVASALRHSRNRRQEAFRVTDARARIAALTPREREIVQLVVNGHLNKEIADRLDIALITVKVHRGRAMRKLGAGNAAELARILTTANRP